MKKIFLILFVFSHFLIMNSAHGNVTLGNIRAFIDKDYNEFVTELNFSKSIDLSKIKLNHKRNRIEINIPKVKTEEKNVELNIGDKDVKAIKVKRNSKSVKISIMFTDKINGNYFEGFTRLEKDGQLVRLSFKRYSHVLKAQNREKNKLTPTSISFNREPAVVAETDQKEAATNSLSKIDQKNEDTKKESEIPILAGTKEKAASSNEGLPFKTIMSLAILLGFAVGLLFFLKWWSKNHKPNEITNKIRVLTQHHLGPKKSLAIIRVAGEAILIGVTDQNINHIKTLSLLDDEIPETVPQNFQTELNENFQDDEREEPEDFTYGGSVKNTIAKRLKGLRS